MGFGFIKKSGKKPPPPPLEPKPEPKPEAAPAAPPPPENGHPPFRCYPYNMGGSSDIEYIYGMHNLRSIEMSKHKTYRLNYWDDYYNNDDYYGPRQMGIYYPHSHGYHRREVIALPPPTRAPRRSLPHPHSHYPVPYYGHVVAPPQCHYPPPLPPPRRHQFALPPPSAYNHHTPTLHHDDYYSSDVCYYY